VAVRVQELAEFDNHEMLIAFNDDETHLKGYIGIHNTNLGLAVGGTRFLDYKSDTEAAEDALRLSRAMSYKCALAGLPYGGGKGVIVGPPKLKTKELLVAYARVVEHLGGLFKTGTDVGVSDQNVQTMATRTSHMIGTATLADPRFPTTAEFAALGTFYGIQASLKHRFGDASMRGRRIAIKGVGKLGRRLAELCHEAGANLVVADTDRESIAGLVKDLSGVTVTDSDQIHREAADVYAPCALGHDFTLQTIKGLRTTIIAGGANNQLSSPEVGNELYRMGILYAPDYIINAGGLIHVTGQLEPGGYSRTLVEDRVRHISDVLEQIFINSDSQKRPTHVVADELALQIIHRG
jgi:leucine dehydrogenase